MVVNGIVLFAVRRTESLTFALGDLGKVRGGQSLEPSRIQTDNPLRLTFLSPQITSHFLSTFQTSFSSGTVVEVALCDVGWGFVLTPQIPLRW